MRLDAPSQHSEAARRRPRRALLRQAAVLVLAPSLVALLANALRPDGLPFISETDYRAAILVPCPEHLVEGVRLALADVPEELTPFVVLDARGRGEFLAGHLPGAHSVPYDPLEPAALASLPSELQGLRTRPGVRLLVYGDARLDSGRALASHLREEGFADVSWLEGGLEVWAAAGRPVERAGGEVRRVTLAELPDDLAGWTVVDARFSRQFRRGHLPGATSLAARTLESPDDARLDSLRGAPPEWLLVYGSADRGEGEALARVLASGEWAGVAWLEGGFESWAAAGRPVEVASPEGLDATEARDAPEAPEPAGAAVGGEP
jgi:rhodanese-related sulfurtransferase